MRDWDNVIAEVAVQGQCVFELKELLVSSVCFFPTLV